LVEVILENLSKYFGSVRAVDNVNLKIRDKEFLTLLGPSGCGKTTTLRLIAGLETPTNGNIYIGERLVNDLPPKDRNVAMVFQSYALYPHMTVFDNIAFPLKVRKTPKSEIEARVKEVAKLLGIDALLKRKPKELSGGQRQRVALGRAIVRKPSVFLMDEPLSNLDAKLRVHMRAELKRLQKSLETTLIYVTHDQVEAMTMSDRVAIMNDGILQQVDNPETVYYHPSNVWVAGFIGSPSMNFFDCSLVEKEGESWLDAGTFQLLLPKQISELVKSTTKTTELILGIRPEDIKVSKVREPESIESEVYVLEPIGDSVIADLKLGDAIVRARTSADYYAAMGDKAYLIFNKDRLHIFERSTQKAIV
jgi:multiple sugar transport system ATP-binding protein